MAKKKKNLSSVVERNRKDIKKDKIKPNLFEFNYSKKKQNFIDGISQHNFKSIKKTRDNVVTGHPGQSRLNAINKREKTLLPQYLEKDKSNVFIDRRIGEGDTSLTVQDKIDRRFEVETRKRAMAFDSTGHMSKKKLRRDKFNLSNDFTPHDEQEEEGEQLTHRGLSIQDLERFDQPLSSDDDGDDFDGGLSSRKKPLNADFVSSAHFGGFMEKSDYDFAKSNSNAHDGLDVRKSRLENMIAESKKRRAEKQRSHDQILDMTQKLDCEWKVFARDPSKSASSFCKNKTEIKLDGVDISNSTDSGYDSCLKEFMIGGSSASKVHENDLETNANLVPLKLKLEASDRLKGEEELAEERRKKLEKLEANRLKRMTNKADWGEDEPFEEFKLSIHKTSSTTNQSPSAILPFLIEKIPNTYDELLELIGGLEPDSQVLLLKRLLHSNLPSSTGEKFENKLFVLVIKYVLDVCDNFEQHSSDDTDDIDSCEDRKNDENSTPPFEIELIERITPFLYDLITRSQQFCANHLNELLKEQVFHKLTMGREDSELNFSDITLLTICCRIFSVSDYRHPVASRIYLLLSQYLSSHSIFFAPTLSQNSDENEWNGVFRHSLAIGLYVSTLFAQCIKDSHRFVPELLNFLIQTVRVSCTLMKPTPNKPEQQHPTDGFKKFSLSDLTKKDQITMSTSFLNTCLNTALSLLTELIHFWTNVPSLSELFAPLNKILENFELPVVEKFRILLRDDVLNVNCDKRRKISAMSASYSQTKQNILQLYEPKIAENFDPLAKTVRSGGGSAVRDQAHHQELRKMRHKLKRERKGAKKEIRADAAFISAVKLKNTLLSDAKRKKSVNLIVGQASHDQGYLNKLASQKSSAKKRNKNKK